MAFQTTCHQASSSKGKCVCVCVSVCKRKPHKTSGRLCQNINTAHDKAGLYKLIVKNNKKVIFWNFLYYFFCLLWYKNQKPSNKLKGLELKRRPCNFTTQAPSCIAQCFQQRDLVHTGF